MKDYARQENGSLVVMTSCNDEAYPPEKMLDGKENSFWITTGLFPQEFVIQLSKPIQVSQIVVLSLNVKKLAVERCDSDKPTTFEKVFEVDLQNREGRLQTERHQVNIKAKFLKFTLLAGYADFATVNRVSVVGAALDGDDGEDKTQSGGGGGFGGGGGGGGGGAGGEF
ncbi:hypothetical protein FOA52_007882 [Chlamydomonas sp. UWO 241]|nr:hypothetical protein FOA52_007882 [Chlamydomonas sp. UWO 241]